LYYVLIVAILGMRDHCQGDNYLNSCQKSVS